MASDVVLNMIALEYDDTLAAASGQPFEEHLQEIIKAYDGQYILAVEGAVPALADSGYCMVGGHAFINQLKEAAAHCAAIINYGSCSAWGGIQAARPNPTQSTGVPNIIGDKPIINVPGCPPIPEVMTGVIAHYAMFGKLPPVDNEDVQNSSLAIVCMILAIVVHSLMLVFSLKISMIKVLKQVGAYIN